MAGWLAQRTRRFQVVLIIAFIILAGRLWYLQIIKGAYFSAQADGNRYRVIRLAAPRGQIWDREGRLLAGNQWCFAVSIIPGELPPSQAQRVIREVADSLELPPEYIKRRLEESMAYPYEPVRIMVDVPPNAIVSLVEKGYRLPGVLCEQTPRRIYPFGPVTGHVVGYLAAITPSELPLYTRAGYRTSDLVGRTGLEKRYEPVLRGTDGYQRVEVNVLSRPVREVGEQAAVPGHDLHVALDVHLQQTARELLRGQLELLNEAEGVFERHAVLIALDPRSGEILTMVTYPDFDPGNLSFGQGGAQPSGAFFNYAIRGQYMPGSAIKPVLAAAALQENVVTPTELFHADDIGPFGQKKCWTRRLGLPPHGDIDMVGALANSCNDYFWDLSLRLGIDRIAHYLQLFGLGSSTGIDMHPPDLPGLVPDRSWRARREGGGGGTWYPGDTLNVAIGQGQLLVTPLQVAALYGVFATHGEWKRPHLARRIVNAAGETVHLEKSETRRVSLRDEVWETVEEGLAEVVTSGTASTAFKHFPLPACGKTGSAQQANGPADAWFAGYAPRRDPQVVVVVMIKHGESGGRYAAPVARKFLDAFFNIEYPEPEDLPDIGAFAD